MEKSKTPLYLVVFCLAFGAGLIATISISRALTPTKPEAIETNLEQPTTTPSPRKEYPFPTVEC